MKKAEKNYVLDCLAYIYIVTKLEFDAKMPTTGEVVKERSELFVTLTILTVVKKTPAQCSDSLTTKATIHTMSSLPYPKWVRGRVTAGWEQRSSGNCLRLDTL